VTDPLPPFWRLAGRTLETVMVAVEVTVDAAGVTVTFWKLEQSAEREEASGILPVRVPVTARAQLLA